MNRVAWFLFGAIAIPVFGLLFLALSSNGFSARPHAGRVETWMARRIRLAAIPRGAVAKSNPVADSAEAQSEAREHWASHCATCHANDGSGDTAMGKNTYPPAPDMRLAPTQQMSDGELFYAIQNGIRFTAMPAWGNGSPHDDEESWMLVRFIRHLPAMTAAEMQQMMRLNPKTPEEIQEEIEEEKFLKGEDNDESHTRHHNH